MTQTHRRWLFGLGLAIGVSLGCSSRTPPVITPPGQTCEAREVAIVVFDGGSARGVPGVTVTGDPAQMGPDQRVRTTDGSGFSSRVACGPADYTFSKTGFVSQTQNLAGRDASGRPITHRVHLVREIPPHPDPVKGAIRVLDGGRCFADDGGCRTFEIWHAGDLPLRWHAGGQAAVLADLDAAAAAGHQIVRMWSYMPEDGGVWSRGGSPPYPGLDALARVNYVDEEVALINAIAARGMRATLEAGGIAGIDAAAERRLMGLFNQVLTRAGPWKVAWVAPVNEPSSRGIGDDNGDVDPAHLRELVDIARAGTSVLWHLGHASNADWNSSSRWAQKHFTPRDQPFGYYHAWRGGSIADQARHRFSWECTDCEGGGDIPGAWKRLWVDGEGVGRPTCAGSLRCVSVARNGDQLDAEGQSLIVAVQSLRGIGSFMSGNGVQRYQDWSLTTGFREVPWTVRQLHRDVHAFRTHVHGGRSNAVFKAVTTPNALLRVEQSISDDGRIDAVAYADRENQTWRIPVTRNLWVKVCSPKTMTCAPEVRVNAGGSVDLGRVRWGRVLIARPQ